jgi:hypothetical protein
MQKFNLSEHVDVVFYPSDFNTYSLTLRVKNVEYIIGLGDLISLEPEFDDDIHYDSENNILTVVECGFDHKDYIRNHTNIVQQYYGLLTQHQANIIEMKNAHINSITGRVSKVKITKAFGHTNEEGVAEPGLYSCFVDYFEDHGVESEVPVNSIDLIDLQFFPTEDLFYDNLKTLIGGNHQYSNNIAFELIGFSLLSIQEEFAEVFAIKKEAWEKAQKNEAINTNASE